MPLKANDTEILEQPIEELHVTDLFKKFIADNNFKTLSEVIEIDVTGLLKLPGFNYHTLVELTGILEKHNLTGLLKQS